MNRYFYGLIILICSLNLFSATYYVNSIHGNDAYGGTEMGPWEHISYAISQAAATDTLMLSGTFLVTADAGATANGIEITKNLTFIGEGAKNTFVKAASSPGTATTRVFQVNAGITAEIRSLSIQNGVALNGGGIFSRGTLTLESVDISSNECSDSGGGINTTGSLIVKNSCISGNNSVNQGGGILINFSGSKTFEIENCTVSGNSVSDKDGSGGGISIQANALNRNITVSALINSCTIADNSTGKKAGDGLFAYTSEDFTTNNAAINLDIRNSVFDNQYSNYVTDTSNGGTVNLDRSYTFSSDESMGDGTAYYNSVDPMLAPLADNGGQTMTHSMEYGSKLINAISINAGGDDYNGAPLLDQRGVAVNRGDYKDAGAYEFNTPVTFYLNSDTGDDDTGHGTEISPWEHLSKALEYNFEEDTIDMTGTFYLSDDPNVNIYVNNGYVMESETFIQGQGADQTVIKACPNGEIAVSRLFLILEGASLKLKDISLQNGYDDSGAGIQSRSELSLENVMIHDCTTTVHQNGGAIFHSGELLNITNSTIYDNYSSNLGGGLHIQALDDTSTVNITNSTIVRNIAEEGGGAIYALSMNSDSTQFAKIEINLNSCTFAHNEDKSQTGSFLIHNADGLNLEVYTTITNCIIANAYNNYSGYPGQYNWSYSISNDNSLYNTGQGTLKDTDPILDLLKDNGRGTLTYGLFEGSPAIGAIPISAGTQDYNGAPLLDQRGMPIEGSNKDIGAFEGTIPYYLSAPDITGAWGEGIYWLFWNWVERATNYAVYSSEEPYGTFDLEYLCNSETYEYGKDVPFDRSYFFTVTAIDTTHSKKIPQTVEIKKPLR